LLKERVFSILLVAPKGKVITYKEIVRALGNPNLAKVVGNTLNGDPHLYIVGNRTGLKNIF